MGVAVAEAAISAGLTLVPLALARPGVASQTIQICCNEVQIHGAENRDAVLAKALSMYPNLVLVDYTLPASVNDNAEWYCAQGVPFVMGTTGGDRAALMDSVTRAGNYAVIAPQMGKQVSVASFLIPHLNLIALHFPGRTFSQQFPSPGPEFISKLKSEYEAGDCNSYHS